MGVLSPRARLANPRPCLEITDSPVDFRLSLEADCRFNAIWLGESRAAAAELTSQERNPGPRGLRQQTRILIRCSPPFEARCSEIDGSNYYRRGNTFYLINNTVSETWKQKELNVKAQCEHVRQKLSLAVRIFRPSTTCSPGFSHVGGDHSKRYFYGAIGYHTIQLRGKPVLMFTDTEMPKAEMTKRGLTFAGHEAIGELCYKQQCWRRSPEKRTFGSSSS